MDSWTGVGLLAVGLHRQGWDLQLTQYGAGNWRATFYVTGVAHSIVGGSAWEACGADGGGLHSATRRDSRHPVRPERRWKNERRREGFAARRARAIFRT
jgi:hypothetical protein